MPTATAPATEPAQYFTLRLPVALKRAAERRALQEDRSLSALMRQAMRSYLDAEQETA